MAEDFYSKFVTDRKRRKIRTICIFPIFNCLQIRSEIRFFYGTRRIYKKAQKHKNVDCSWSSQPISAKFHTKLLPHMVLKWWFFQNHQKISNPLFYFCFNCTAFQLYPVSPTSFAILRMSMISDVSQIHLIGYSSSYRQPARVTDPVQSSSAYRVVLVF